MSFSNTWPVTELATLLASPPTYLLQLLFPPCHVSNGNMASISVWVLRRHFDACSSWRWPNSQLVLAQGKAIEVVVAAVVVAAVAMSVVAGINNWLQLVWPPLARTAGQQQVKPSVSIGSDTLPVHHGYPMTDSLLVWLDTDGLNLCLCLPLSVPPAPPPGRTSCVANKCGQISVQTAAIKALYEQSYSHLTADVSTEAEVFNFQSVREEGEGVRVLVNSSSYFNSQ